MAEVLMQTHCQDLSTEEVVHFLTELWKHPKILTLIFLQSGKKEVTVKSPSENSFSSISTARIHQFIGQHAVVGDNSMELVVCEKPSQARDIAKVIGCKTRSDGCIKGADYAVTWCVGHLITLAPMDSYDASLKKWSVESLPFIPNDFKLIPIEGTYDQWKKVKALLRSNKFDGVINATDAGREGELIFNLVYKLSGCKKPIKRLWTASLTAESIRQAWTQMKPAELHRGLADAAQCRIEADWLVGLNATRAQTLVSRSNGQSGLFSVGRVQTPTLALLVNREKEIKEFKKEIFFNLLAKFEHEDGSYIGQWFRKDGDKITTRFKAKKDAKIIYDCLSKSGEIIKAESKEEKQKAPLLYDLTSLQKEANKRFAFTAEQTLKTCQSLYEKHKVLSYPRTNSRYLTVNDAKKLDKIVHTSLKQGAFSKDIDKVFLTIPDRYVNEKKVEDHHAIIPTGEISSRLTDDEAKVFDLVIRRTIAAYSRDRIVRITKAVTQVNQETFASSGLIVIEQGWSSIDPPTNTRKETILPNLRSNDVVRVIGKQIKEGETKPPARYTEASLLGAMQTAGKLIEDEELAEAMKDSGLGTPATRAAIIENLKKRGFVSPKGKQLIPSDQGIQLIHSIPNESIKSAELTGKWEKRLLDMEKDKYCREKFMSEITQYTKSMVASILQSYNHQYRQKQTKLLFNCYKCESAKYSLREYKGQFYARCTDDNCKDSFPTDSTGSPLKSCKACNSPMRITKSGSAVCVKCGKWDNSKSKKLTSIQRNRNGQ